MKTYIKSLLAIATVALLGSSAQADQNVEVEVGKTITITSQSEVSRNAQWKVDWNNDQSRSEIKNPSDSGFTIDGNYQTKSTAGTVQFTVTGNSPTAANNPVVLRLKQKSSSGGTSTVLEKINVTVVAAAPTVIEKTVEVGKTINFNSTAKITANYNYQFIIDGSSTAVTRTPTSVTKNGGSAANVALSLTGVSVTTSPVTLKLQQRSGNYGNWTDVETYSVTVTAKEPDPVTSAWFKDQEIKFTSGVYTNWVNNELVIIFKGNNKMTLPADATVDYLVVGGAGGGGAGSGSAQGTGGKGATVTYKEKQTLAASTLNVTVGTGGSGGTGGSSQTEANRTGKNGDQSSLGTITAAGGTGGQYKGGNPGSGGSGHGQYNISGTPTYYGEGGSAGEEGHVGDPGAPNTGNGGQGGGTEDLSGGAGADGVVIVRIKDWVEKPIDDDASVTIKAGESAEVTTSVATDASKAKASVAGLVTVTADGKTTTLTAGTTLNTGMVRLYKTDGTLVKRVNVTVSKNTQARTSEKAMMVADPVTSLTLDEEFPIACTWSATSDKQSVATVSMSGSGSTKTPTIKITQKGVTGTAKITVSNTDNKTACAFTWTVTVTVTEKIDEWPFKNKTVQTTGAEKLSQTDNELVLAWKSGTGSLILPDLAIADVLVVGGGGGGGGGQRSSSNPPKHYWGDAGSGGAVERMSAEIGAEGVETSFAIKVGAGGTAGKGGTSTETGTDGGKGEASSFSGNGLTIPAEGGVGGRSRKTSESGEDKSESTSKPGSGWNYVSKITGETYSVPGNVVTQEGKGSAQDAKNNTGNGGDAGSDPASTAVSYGGAGGSGIVIVRITNWKMAYEPVEVPTAVPGLVYDYTEKTGVVAQTGYTLTGNTGVIASNYTAVATLDEGYCWADDSSTTNKFIPWEIGYKSATVTAVSTNKLVGTADPVFTTKAEGFIANDPSVLTWKVWAKRTNDAETVGFYDLIAYGDARQGSYDITYVDVVNGFEIRAGKVNVNGKGYDDVAAAFAALQAGGNATFNEQVKYDAFTFAQGTTMTVADGAWFVTNDLTIAETTVTNDISVAQKLTLAGEVTVGDDDHEAILAFAEIDNKDGAYKLTLTTNGVVQSATQLDDAVFAEVEHFHVAEKPIAGGFEYTLEATEFYVKYYDGDEVVHSNKFTILNYTTDLHIWNGDRSDEGLELVKYEKEKGGELAQTDDALRAYVKEEAEDPGCDGEVKVLGTWNTCVEVPTAVDDLVYDGTEQTGVEEGEGYTLEDNTATDAGSYTATATLKDGYCWADGKTEQKTIDWSIGKFAITVTPVATNKLVGAEDPELTYTTDKDLFGDDEFIGKLARSAGEEVGNYNITQGTLAIDDGNEGKNYDLTFDTASGEDAFEIKAGVINVNGKGYATVEEAFAALVLAAKSGTATAVFNEAVEAQGYKFAQGTVLTIEQGGVWTVTGDVTMPMVEKEKKVSVDGVLTLAGNVFVGDRADVTTEVLAEKVVLAANVTVGAATEGLDPAGIATLAFDEIEVGAYKLTLTTNGVVQSATALDIDAIFTEAPEFFQITETQIDGGFEYTLEALTVVELPTANDLTYNGEVQTGVDEGEGYTLTDNTGKNADDYMATATLEPGYCWSDGSTDAKTIDWSIDYAQVTVTADDDDKTEGEDDPVFTATVEGEVAGEEGTIKYTLEREEGEDPGPYTIFAQGAETQGNYKVTYVDGTFWINPKPTITIHIKQGEGIFDVMDEDGESVEEDLELSAGTTQVKLTLEATGLTVPVFKVVRGNVTNVTTKVETYAITDGDTLEFFAEEADETDPTVTDDDIKTALIESIDDPDHDVCEAAAKKVDDVVGTDANQVSARDLAAYINKNGVQSFEIADCDYVAASVKLDTDDLIDEDTEVEIAELVKAEGDALTFAVDIENDRVEVEAIKDMVEASSDLTAWKDHILEVKADFDDKTSMVTITPKDPTDKAFMKVVIPKDPGVE